MNDCVGTRTREFSVKSHRLDGLHDPDPSETIICDECGGEVVVILDVDEETISDEGLVFCGEVFTEDELPSLEEESV